MLLCRLALFPDPGGDGLSLQVVDQLVGDQDGEGAVLGGLDSTPAKYLPIRVVVELERALRAWIFLIWPGVAIVPPGAERA